MATNPYTYSTTPGSNTSLNGVTMAEGMNAGLVNDGVRQFAADFAALLKDISCSVTAGGSANAITVTANSAFAAYAQGLIVGFTAANNNSGATTLNVNAVGAKSLRTSNDAALVGGEIKTGIPYIAIYSTAANAAAGAWILVNASDLAAFVATSVTAGTMTISGTTPTLTLTDTDTGADCRVSGSSANGTLRFDADLNNEAGSSSIQFGIDGSIMSTWAPNATHIGKTSASISTAGVSLFTDGLIQATRVGDVVMQLNRTSSGGTILEFLVAGTSSGSVFGSVGTVTYNTTSDKRMKENLREFDSGAIIDGLEIWEFDWKHGGSGVGVMAQDAYEVFPAAVFKPEDDEKPWQVDYSKYVPLLIQEIQNLRRRLDGLEAA